MEIEIRTFGGTRQQPLMVQRKTVPSGKDTNTFVIPLQGQPDLLVISFVGDPPVPEPTAEEELERLRQGLRDILGESE